MTGRSTDWGSTGASLAIFQQVVPHYRIGIFEQLGRRLNGSLTVYAESFASPLKGLRAVRVRSIGFGRTRFHGLPILNLLRGRHSTIICEGRLGLITSTVLAIFGKAAGIRVIWWSPLWRPNGRIEVGGGFRGWFQRLVLRRSAAVLAYSSTAAEVACMAGVAREHVHTARNSLDTHKLVSAERRWRERASELTAFQKRTGLEGCRVALFVGQISPRKRLDALIEAFKRVAASDSSGGNLRLVIVGNGPDLRKCRDLTCSLGLEQMVLFAGEITDIEDICPYFLSSRVVVLPGAGGLVINQALTHGVPVIVGMGGGDGTERDSITDRKNGIFWDGLNVGQLAEQIESFLVASEENWAVWSRQARDSVRERVNIDIMLAGIQRALEGGKLA